MQRVHRLPEVHCQNIVIKAVGGVTDENVGVVIVNTITEAKSKVCISRAGSATSRT